MRTRREEEFRGMLGLRIASLKMWALKGKLESVAGFDSKCRRKGGKLSLLIRYRPSIFCVLDAAWFPVRGNPKSVAEND